jgi:anti-anti-sigma factor
MDLGIEKKGAVTVAALAGAFDVEDAQRVADELQPLVAEGGSRLAVDLAGLETISSAGLSEMIAVVTRARLSGSRVVLVSPGPFVRQVFSVTRLDEWFEIFDSVDAAVDSLQG